MLFLVYASWSERFLGWWHRLSAGWRDFLAGDLPSWIAALVAVVALVLMIHALLRARTQIIFPSNRWSARREGEKVIIVGVVRIVPAVGSFIITEIERTFVFGAVVMKGTVTTEGPPLNRVFQGAHELTLRFAPSGLATQAVNVVRVDIVVRLIDRSKARFRRELSIQ